MRKLTLICAALTAAAAANAQDIFELSNYLDEKEDTTQVVTIADIVNVQELVATSTTTASHFSSVWGYNKYFHISYGKVTMEPKQEIDLGYSGYNNGKAPTFNADWSLALTLGRNYGLHKKPLGNTVKINLDFTYFDLSFTHFKAEGEKNQKLYDSSAVWTEKDEDGNTEERSYIPWCLQKYKGDFGMAIGPSITIAPFNYVNSKQLHFLKLNAYYHIGYHASIMWMNNDENADASEAERKTTTTVNSSGYYTNTTSDDSSSFNINWGHGLTNAFGISLSWKAIGIGYEYKSTNLKYKSVTPSTYGNASYKFKTTSNRIYLVIRY